MADDVSRRPSRRPRSRRRKLTRTFRLTPGKIESAQRILGAATATETIETALDMVVFRHELVSGAKGMLGVKITSPDRR